MSRRVPQHSGFRIVIALITCAAFIPLPNIASLVSEAAQNQAEHGKAKPRPGKPEGDWPDLEDVTMQKEKIPDWCAASLGSVEERHTGMSLVIKIRLETELTIIVGNLS